MESGEKVLNYQQRLELLMQCKLKKIRQKELASVIGTSSAWVSMYFSHPNISINEQHEKQIIEFVNSK